MTWNEINWKISDECQQYDMVTCGGCSYLGKQFVIIGRNDKLK